MNNNVGNITVIREQQFVGALVAFEVYIDNQGVGSLMSHQQVSAPVYYGNHIVTIKTIDKAINQEIVINDQQRNAFIQVNCKMGLITGRPNITNIYFQ